MRIGGDSLISRTKLAYVVYAETPLFMVSFVREPTRLMRHAGTIGQDCSFRLLPSSCCVASQKGIVVGAYGSFLGSCRQLSLFYTIKTESRDGE